MFLATVLVAILTKFDVGVTLLGIGYRTIIALLVSGLRIPMSMAQASFISRLSMTVMALYDNACYTQLSHLLSGWVRIVQVGIKGTAFSKFCRC